MTHLIVQKWFRDGYRPHHTTLGDFVLDTMVGREPWGEKKDGIEDRLEATQQMVTWLLELLIRKGLVTIEEVMTDVGEDVRYEVDK